MMRNIRSWSVAGGFVAAITTVSLHHLTGCTPQQEAKAATFVDSPGLVSAEESICIFAASTILHTSNEVALVCDTTVEKVDSCLQKYLQKQSQIRMRDAGNE